MKKDKTQKADKKQKIKKTTRRKFLKTVAPPNVAMSTIFKSSVPFMFLQAIGLFLAIAFPWLCIWLPRVVYGH